MTRTYSESGTPSNFPGVSSGSGVKRPHGESIKGEDEEQLATPAALIAGLHRVTAAKDDEICSGNGSTEDWLSAWYPETHMSRRMVMEAKRKDGKIQENEGHRVTRES